MAHQSGVAGGQVRCGWERLGLGACAAGNVDDVVVRGCHAVDRPMAYGRGETLAPGSPDAHGWSESGSVPPSVGVHGTSVSIGPVIPPS